MKKATIIKLATAFGFKDMCLFRNIKQYFEKCCGEGIRMNKISGDTVNLKQKKKLSEAKKSDMFCIYF